ncbi:MAG TPA: type II toxin-antitoxin system RelE/ParE family toxin [Nitrospiraceae bacterium]|nr:type II toxin-antitoxin system RelE/ParE family toxin [Nitrospiraceae bacterium]
MPYTVQLAPAAQRQLQSLPKPLQSQITKRLLKLEVTPRPEGVKKLEGENDLYRLRVGDYRIIYTIRDRELIVLVLKVSHRREIYR